MGNINIADAGILAVLGYGVVFFGLILLLIVVIAMGKAFQSGSNKSEKVEQQAAPAPVAAPAAAPNAPVITDGAAVAPGSAGTLKLHDVPPKTAAMLMAIVADKMGKPLNELRFISIKEVK